MRTLFSYVDPGAGATLVQLALAGVVGIGAIFKAKWARISEMFSRSDKADEVDAPTE